jgi:DNA-binding NarL/FixJ family response regulator
MLRLLLVEDHASFRQALKFLLNLRPDMRVVAGCRALEGLGSVDVALLDLMLPDGDGTELIVVLRGANPWVAERAAEAGADGVLNKATALTEIVAEVARLAR